MILGGPLGKLTILILLIVYYSYFIPVSLGLLEIFDHFINVTGLIDKMPIVFQPIAGDIVDDIRRLIPEVEKISDKYNVTEPILKEIGNALNITRVTHELLPELEKILEDENLSETIKEIVGYLNLSRVEHEYFPELDKFLDQNNVSEILDEIRELLNVTVIADILLPEIERLVTDLKAITGVYKYKIILARYNSFFDKMYSAPCSSRLTTSTVQKNVPNIVPNYISYNSLYYSILHFIKILFMTYECSDASSKQFL